MNVQYEIMDLLVNAKEKIDKAYAMLIEENRFYTIKTANNNYDKWNTREHLIFDEDYKPENYGKRGSYTRHFDNMSVDTAEVLIKQGFLDPGETQNESPTVAEFIEFAKEHSDGNFTFHGYVVGPERDDCRVSFEGVEGNSDEISKETIIDFSKMFMEDYHADDVEIKANRLYCWYD